MGTVERECQDAPLIRASPILVFYLSLDMIIARSIQIIWQLGLPHPFSGHYFPSRGHCLISPFYRPLSDHNNMTLKLSFMFTKANNFVLFLDTPGAAGFEEIKQAAISAFNVTPIPRY